MIETTSIPPSRSTSLSPSYWRGLMLIALVLGVAWINLSRITDASLLAQDTEAPRAGFLAPDFSLETTDGKTIRLSELRGTPVILNFWATWCPPCRREMPALEAIQQRYAGQLLVLAIDQGERAQVVESFARRQVGVTFPLLLDPNQEAGRRYNVHALPTTVYVAADGRIRQVTVGGPLDEASLIGGVNSMGIGE